MVDTMILCTFWLVVGAALLLSHGQAFSIMASNNARRRRARPLLFASSPTPLTVALTREEGKNEKLRKELENALLGDDSLVTLKELPCVAHARGKDFDLLASTLSSDGGGQWDYVAVTSPEAARVLATAWGDNSPSMKDTTSVVAVGKATQATLEKLGIVVDFCPSKATATTLVEELPPKKRDDKTTTTLLYPASAKAASTLERGLTARGFAVTRLNTYDTITATWDDEQRNVAKQVDMVCFGSPSAVEGWLVNTNNNKDVVAVCIGETSATACRKNEWPEEQIYYPEKPGIAGWAAAAKEALNAIQVAHM